MASSSTPAAAGAPSRVGRRRRRAGGRRARRRVNGLADAQVGGAAAEVAVHRRVDVGVGRLGRVRQQRRRRHDLAGLAVAALRHVELLPGPLQRMRAVGRQALDGRDLEADAADTGVEHERIAWPLACTVQAPHWPMPQPNFVPFRSSTSRSTHSSGMSGGTSTVVDFPFTFKVTGMAHTPRGRGKTGGRGIPAGGVDSRFRYPRYSPRRTRPAGRRAPAVTPRMPRPGQAHSAVKPTGRPRTLDAGPHPRENRPRSCQPTPFPTAIAPHGRTMRPPGRPGHPKPSDQT